MMKSSRITKLTGMNISEVDLVEKITKQHTEIEKTNLEKRNWVLDYLKGISCIAVVFLHCHLWGIIGDGFIYAIRFPVPIFFMITGYYCNKKDDAWIYKKFKYLFHVLLATEFAYFIGRLILNCLIADDLTINFELIKEMFQHPIRKVLCGSFFNGTLWYLYAILWTYLILLFFRKTGIIQNSVFCITLILILVCVQVLGRVFVTAKYNIEENVYLFRNAVTFGLPMTLIGVEVCKHEEFIKQKVSFPGCLKIELLGFVTMVLEYFLYGKYLDFHFSTLFISVGLFLMAFTYSGKKFPFSSIICWIGQKLSMWIYLIHYFPILTFDSLNVKYGFDAEIYDMIRPLLVLLFTIMLAYIANGINHRIRTHS